MAKLVSRLVFIAEHSPEAASLALHDTANHVLSLVRLYVHVITGWLRDSYRKESVAQLHIIIGTMVDYAVWEELGTMTRKAHYHLTPAFAESERYFQETFAKYLKNLG